MGSRSDTRFYKISGFIKAIQDLGVPSAMITEHIAKFERAWCESRMDGDVPSRYHFEHYKKVTDPYRLCHVRVGPNNNYRAVVMFPDGRANAYWIYVYKKEGNREPQEMELARKRAKQFWETVKETPHE
ncbi:MAG: hypothetical protein ACRDIV_18560 [Ktedonobacteraceae bacterium]